MVDLVHPFQNRGFVSYGSHFRLCVSFCTISFFCITTLNAFNDNLGDEHGKRCVWSNYWSFLYNEVSCLWRKVMGGFCFTCFSFYNERPVTATVGEKPTGSCFGVLLDPVLFFFLSLGLCGSLELPGFTLSIFSPFSTPHICCT